MPSSEISGLTEDTTPDTTDIVYVQDSAGTVDKKVPLANLPIPDLVQNSLDNLDDAVTAHLADTTAVHGLTNTTALPEVWVSNGAGGYVLGSTINRIYVGPDNPATASPGGRSQNYDIWIDTTP